MVQAYIKQLIFSWLRMVHRKVIETKNRERNAFPICLSRVASEYFFCTIFIFILISFFRLYLQGFSSAGWLSD